MTSIRAAVLVGAVALGLPSVPMRAFAQSGLVAAYGFNETSGTTTADASGNNNTGTLGTGVTRTASGKFGGALTFSGNFVTVPHAASLNLTTAMTLEAWVFPTNSTSGYATAVMKEQPGEFVYSLYARAPTTPGGYFNAGTASATERQVNAPSALAVNTWTHLAATFDGTTTRFYVNGVQVASKAVAGPIATSTGALRIGGNGVWGEFFTGRIDEVRIYNRALSVTEVQTDMNTAVGSGPPPDSTPPTVAIVNPSSTGSFTTTTSPLNMDGTASDNVGVTSVTWANNRGGSGTATGTTSWSVSGVALQPGANVLTVTARDAAGNIATSTLTVTYNVADTTVPTIGITGPTSGSTYLTNTTPLTVSGNAADNVGVTSVTWTNSAGGSGTATGTTSWSVSGIALQPGANVLTVTAHDAAENVASATLTVTLDATVPTVNLTAPGAGATVSGTTVAMTASAADNNALAGVTFLLDGAALGAEVLGTGPNFNFTWNTVGVANGPHTLSARARDGAGNTALAPDVSVTVNNASSGLVAAYGFNETSGTTTADASGNNNTGTLGTGVTRTASGKFGGALTFSGNFVTVPDAASLDLTTAMTLEAWVFPTTSTSGYATAVMKEQSGEFVYSLYARAPTTPGGYFNAGTASATERQVNAPSALTANTWTHLAATFDGSTTRVYVNGVQVASKAVTGPITTSTGALRIGGNGVWGEFFTGRIDEVRIYNRALSATEVQTDMNTAVDAVPPPDVTPPTVAIVNPSSTGSFTTTTGSVNMDGTAGDNVGVTSVTWANNRGGSGTATGTTSWSVSGVALQPGANVLTVTSHDAAGNVATATLTVTYNVADTTVPTIGITSPTSGATYLTNTTPLSVSGNAADNVGVTSVTWANNRGGSGTATGTTSWTVSGIALQSGANVLTVTAHDGAGNVASATLTVTLDATVPTIAIVNPSSTGTFTTTTSPLNVDGTAADNAGVTSVTWANNRGGSGTATGTTSWSVSGVALQPGANVLTVTAHDAAGNIATSTLTVTYNVADTTVPTIGITGPTSGATYLTNTTPLTVSGNAADNVGVTSVTWTNSAGGSGTATGTTSWSVSGIALQPGANVLTVTAHDAAENVASATLTVTLDATVPTVNLTAPGAGATVSGTTVAVTASAADNNALAGVTFLLDGAALGAEVLGTGPNFNFTWNTVGVANGPHTLSARARDAAGNTGLAPDVSVTVNNVSSGLVAAYGFNETSGTTTTDASGNNNTGTFGGGVTRTLSGKFGGALTFSGNFVTVPDAASLDLTTAMTLEAWVFPTSSPTDYATVLMKEQPSDYVYVLYNSAPNNPSAEINISALHSGERATRAPSPLPVNTWSHLASTFDGTTVRVYVNGVQVVSQAVAGPIATSTGALRIGGNAVWGEFFTGRIDEVRIYNRALSVTEVQTDMNTAVDAGPPPDVTPPTVAIVNPSSTGSFTTTANSVNMDGTAGDNVGVTSVTWANNRGGSGTAIGTTGWSVSGVALQPGTNVLTVTAHDAAGNVATATLTVTYNIPDTTVPTVAITSPTSGATYLTNATPLTVSGNAADNVGVTQVTWTNSAGGSGTATGTTSWTASGIALQSGANVLTVTARDAAGNIATATLTVTLDATVPTVAIVNPSSTGSFTTTTTPLSMDGTAGDNVGVTSVTWTNNRGGSGTATGTTSWSVSGVVLQTGANVLTVTSHDAAGNVATATLTVTYNVADTTVPTIGITGPTSGATYLTNTTPLTVSGNAADNVGVTSVTWTNSAGGSGAATGTTSWSVSGIVLQPGANVVTVTAHDAAENIASATLTVTLDATVPTVNLTAPSAGATVSGSSVAMTASAADNNALAGVTFLLDGAALGAEVLGTGPNFNFTWNTTGVTNGSHTLSARARDAAGNTALAPDVAVSVNNAVVSGPVAAFGFNEASGNTTADASGHNNNGTLGSGVSRTTSGKFGGALSFNNGFVTVPHAASLNLTTAMTLEAWVFPTGQGDWATAVMKEQSGEFVYALYADAPTTPGSFFNVGTSVATERSINGAFALPLNTWSHLATTFDGTTLRVYVNGSQVASQPFTGPIATSTGALRIGGNGVWGEFFSGRIDDVRVYDRALNSTELYLDMVTGVGQTQPPDNSPPTVAVTAPTEGASVNGSVSLAASANDDVGVAGVQFLVDGNPVGPRVQSAPYTMSWDATTASDGVHTIEAVALDFSGKTTTSAPVHVTVTVANGSTLGHWTAPFDWPLISIHAALLKTGEVLGWEYSGAGGPVLWNPVTNQFTPVPAASNLFCGGQTIMPDGRVLVAGGHVGAHVGIADVNIFDPLTRGWTRAPDMNVARWYPTVTTLGDGRALITAGEINCDGCNALIPEVYNPLTNQMSRLSSASMDFPYYPHVFALPDGRVLVAASSEAPIITRVLNVATQTWSVVDPVAVDGGSSVMYLPGKIMKSGTSHNPDLPPDPSFPNTYVLDMTAPTPRWTQTAPMAFARTYHVLTALPDGSVLATGGATTTDPVSDATAVLAAELWNPTTQTWSTLASGQVSRLYHSVAVLLPDGRILVAGGGRFFGFPSNDVSDHLNAEIFSPPYLFKGARPTITSAPETATFGSTIPVQTPDAAGIASVSLIRMAAVTHAINMDQRFIPLSFTAGGGQLDVQMPANANLAPPGYYMLFIVNGNGVPSPAAIIKMQ